MRSPSTATIRWPRCASVSRCPTTPSTSTAIRSARARRLRPRAQVVIETEWGRDLIRSWNTAGWFALPRRLGNRLAPLIGAAEGEVGA